MSLAKLGLASLLTLLAVSPQDVASDQTTQADLAKLSWLAGTWKLKDSDKTTKEHWLPLAGTTMTGVSHTYDGTTTRFFELLRVTFQNGKLAYVAQPGGGKSLPFFAVKLDDVDAVFENEKHDHPQRIRYERTEGGVSATVSLLDGSMATTCAYRRGER